MLLADVVSTSQAVAATRSRKAKIAALADTLARAATDEVDTVVSYLSGSLRQRRTGVGWRGISELPPPADSPSLEVLEVHQAFDAISRLAGAGSQTARKRAVTELLSRATADEQRWLQAVVTGNVRQGALDTVMQEAVAQVADLPVADVRRAAMLAGGTLPVAIAALSDGAAGLSAFRLEVGRPVMPMLASSAPDIASAMDEAVADGPVVIDAKLDGIRIQAHRRDGDVLIVTRSLDDITRRLPEVAEVVRSLPGGDLVLDGEAMLVGPDERPRPFQETASRTAQGSGDVVMPFFFDVLHHDSIDLLDSPATERLAVLDEVVPGEHRVARVVTSATDEAAAFVADVLARGHEGVIVKDPQAPYAAGRRGSAWVKVKPVHTLDLVVLAVEWGSGRREGWLSNIHLGARGPDGELLMVGKTFKGMTDEMLAWQTERFADLALEPATMRDHYVVPLRPEQVVEIALDGVQRSTRYPGGVALRFARVVRYRDDKSPAEADTIDTVRALGPGQRSST